MKNSADKLNPLRGNGDVPNTQAVAKKVKENVLFLSTDNFLINFPVTVDDGNFRNFLVLKSSGCRGIGIPIDFGNGTKYYPCENLHVVN